MNLMGKRHRRTHFLSILVSCGLWLSASYGMAGTDTLFPETTQAYIEVSNVAALETQWNQTSFSKLVEDPQVKKFAEDIQRQFEQRWGRSGALVGITWADFAAISSGEMAIGTIPSPDKLATELFLVNVSGKTDAAKQLLERIATNVQKNSGKVSTTKISNLPATYYELARPTQWKLEKPPILYSAIYQDWLLISDNTNSIFEVCLRIGGVKKESLAGVEAYQKSVAMLSDPVTVDGLLRFYVSPKGLVELLDADPSLQRGEMSKTKSAVQLFQEQGLQRMNGIAGRVDAGTNGCENVWKLAVYAPPPHESSFAMLKLLDAQVLPIDAWVPKDSADCITLNVDVQNAFDHFGPVFDEIAGEKGTWEEVLRGLQIDPNGVQIDIQKELIAYLGNRATLASKYRLPTSTTSQRYIIAVDSKDDAALQKGLAKFFHDSPEMQQKTMGNVIVWERVPEMALPESISDPTKPSFGRNRTASKARTASRTVESEKNDFFPNRVFAVAQGKFWVASHLDILQEVLAADAKGGFGTTVEAKLVDQKFTQLGATNRGLRMTFKLDELVRNDYELAREGKFGESKTFVGRIFASILPGLERPEDMKFDMSSAPEFGFIRRFLGPGGLEIETVPEGWLVRGFILTK